MMYYNALQRKKELQCTRIRPHLADELKQIQNGRIQQIIARAIALQAAHNRAQDVQLDKVAVVEVVFCMDNGAQQAKGP
jgi:hypothetical protein